MKNYFIIILSIFILSSCVEENPDNKIEVSPLEDDKFQKIIKKIWLMNAHLYNNTLIHKDSLAEATNNGVDIDIHLGNVLVFQRQYDGQWKLLARQAYKLKS